MWWYGNKNDLQKLQFKLLISTNKELKNDTESPVDLLYIPIMFLNKR